MRDLKRIQRLSGGGCSADGIRAVDWSATSLGPMENWSECLCTVVQLVLYSPTAACLFWGPEGTMLYNEDWGALLGGLHPALFGKPASLISRGLHRLYLARLERMDAGETPTFMIRWCRSCGRAAPLR